METNIRKQRYKHFDCKASHFEHLNICIFMHERTNERGHVKIDGPGFVLTSTNQYPVLP